MGPHGYNPNYPQCRNPWNPDHIPSGSSSGSGVAVGGSPGPCRARLGHRRLDPLPGRRFGRDRPDADLWPGEPPRRHADVALARRGRPAGADRARLRPAAGRPGRRRSRRRQLARHAGARLRSRARRQRAAADHRHRARLFRLRRPSRRGEGARPSRRRPAARRLYRQGRRAAGRPARRDRRAASAGHEVGGRGQPYADDARARGRLLPSRSATACMPASSFRPAITSAR